MTIFIIENKTKFSSVLSRSLNRVLILLPSKTGKQSERKEKCFKLKSYRRKGMKMSWFSKRIWNQQRDWIVMASFSLDRLKSMNLNSNCRYIWYLTSVTYCIMVVIHVTMSDVMRCLLLIHFAVKYTICFFHGTKKFPLTFIFSYLFIIIAFMYNR